MIDAELIPDDIKSPIKSVSGKVSVAGKSASTLQDMEQEMIRQTLSEANHNKSLAAKKLGISRRTLYRKLEEYKIDE